MTPSISRHPRRAALRAVIVATGLVVAGGVAAEPELNIEPGQWEFNSTMRMEGAMNMPEQQSSESQCLTQEEIDQGPVFTPDDEEGCEILSEDISRDRVVYQMRCEGGDGMAFEADYAMDLMGDQVRGTMTGDMETPMGEMTLNMEFDGERVGDC